VYSYTVYTDYVITTFYLVSAHSSRRLTDFDARGDLIRTVTGEDVPYGGLKLPLNFFYLIPICLNIDFLCIKKKL
jgi:hypothetical protein